MISIAGLLLPPSRHQPGAEGCPPSEVERTSTASVPMFANDPSGTLSLIAMEAD